MTIIIILKKKKKTCIYLNNYYHITRNQNGVKSTVIISQFIELYICTLSSLPTTMHRELIMESLFEVDKLYIITKSCNYNKVNWNFELFQFLYLHYCLVKTHIFKFSYQYLIFIFMQYIIKYRNIFCLRIL